MKWLVRISFALGLAAALVAGVLFWFDYSKPQHEFALGQTEFEWTGIGLGERELVIPITNATKIPRRIIGLQEG